ncbi:hypothetical protein L3Q82_013470 [Scortum barcoo]|uniref:Uncharacterized protein n=1 Tax=Scortum barcoo TaxID=214431 RepID=A0ACB8VZZ1_9TELE|nr:hypothetical protein L3Q82_013470 [Scortum barcoo]
MSYGVDNPRPDLNPIENLWGDIKNAVSEAKPRNAKELWNAVKSSWAGIPSQVPEVGRLQCNTDVKQFSETVVIQVNISLVIHRNAKSYKISVYTVNI